MDNKIKYAIALLVFCPLVFMILACAAAVGSISILAGAALSTDYDIHETELYKQVEELTAEYMEGITEKIHDQAERIREEHMEYVEQDDGTYEWECTVEVHETTYRINTTCFYAYTSTTNMDLLSGSAQNYLPTMEEIASIYDRITKIVVDESDDGEDYYVYNKVASSREMKKIFFPDDEIQQSFYQSSFDNFYDMIGDDLDYADGFLDEEELEEIAANNMGIPLYLQYQAPWGSQAYGHGTIATSGCGPTCLAMVISYLTDSSVLPSDVVNWAGNRYYVAGAGSSWAIYPAAAQHWGLQCTRISKTSAAVAEELSEGHPVILSMGPGTFTRSGHFIVLSGITEDGRVYVNDPNDSDSKQFYNKTFSLPEVLSESKAAWAFQ